MNRLATSPLALLLLIDPGSAVAKEVGAAKGESDVVGLKHIPGNASQREQLLRDGIVVLPRFQEQIFQPYIGQALPYYITCESARWAFQHLLDESIQLLEKKCANLDLRPSQSVRSSVDV